MQKDEDKEQQNCVAGFREAPDGLISPQQVGLCSALASVPVFVTSWGGGDLGELWIMERPEVFWDQAEHSRSGDGVEGFLSFDKI